MQEIGVKNSERNALNEKKIKLINLLNEFDLSKLTPTEIRFMSARIDAFLNVSIFEVKR